MTTLDASRFITLEEHQALRRLVADNAAEIARLRKAVQILAAGAGAAALADLEIGRD